MKNSLFFGILICAVTFLHCQPVVSPKNSGDDKNLYTKEEKKEKPNFQKRVDDWNSSLNLSATEEYMGGYKGRGIIGGMGGKGMVLKAVAPAPNFEKIGLTPGGGKDIGAFEENLKRGYLPLPTSITYTGVFYQHYFQLPARKCLDLFCPTYTTAKDHHPFTHRPRQFLLVGLDSNLTTEVIKKRPPLNLVIVLDVSGSMSSPFSHYYYDHSIPNKSEEEENKNLPKIRIATKVLGAVLKKLRPTDRVAIVLFNHRAGVAKPFRLVGETDIPAIVKHLNKVSADGGTNWEAGYRLALQLFHHLPEGNRQKYENRILFLTDAMPNTGAISKGKLLDLVKTASKEGIYTTFVGVGLDFNTNLVDFLGKVKGANYFFIKSPAQFKKRIAQEFDYWVTPLVFDLKMELKGDNFQIVGVYGTPTPSTSKTLISIPTLFPSPTTNGKTKGGVILVELKSKPHRGREGEILVSFQDREGRTHKSVTYFEIGKGYYYGNRTIRKAILLTDFVKLMKGWLIRENAKCSRTPDFCFHYYGIRKCPPVEALYPFIPPLPPKRSQWEIGSCPLKVDRESCHAFAQFIPHYRQEMEEIGDQSLKKEYKLLQLVEKNCPLKGEGK